MEITAGNLVSHGLEFRKWRKTAVTEAAFFAAQEPTEIQTKEGLYKLPEDWRGYIAIDTDGDPYPVEEQVFKSSYVLA